ncbi:MAG: hypothetical protein IIA62_00320 [Nitrospinae bacterium]|nr:hypothetical protein [Nitrospinota bacterium]
MAFDFLKNLPHWEDDERFARLCENIEEVIHEAMAESGKEKISELELMQALDFIGFNLFRDSWDEFKKMNVGREFGINPDSPNDKKYLH